MAIIPRHFFIKRIQHLPSFHYSMLMSLLLTFSVLLSGCQLLSKNISPAPTNDKAQPNNTNYLQYYQRITQLSAKQLTEEVGSQQALLNLKNNDNNASYVHKSDHKKIESQLKLVLLSALPQSSIHNPFNAKSTLNRIPVKALKKHGLISTDLTFFSMLKTQLNQQILLLNQIVAAKTTQQTIELSKQQLQLEIQHLQQQIIQLKKN